VQVVPARRWVGAGAGGWLGEGRDNSYHIVGGGPRRGRSKVGSRVDEVDGSD
jgi:hypothetical protein